MQFMPRLSHHFNRLNTVRCGRHMTTPGMTARQPTGVARLIGHLVAVRQWRLT
jgi:hypothetical protein